MATNLESLKAKLSALRAKTTANGCTEGEAMAAAAAAARIMQRHGIDAAQLDTIASGSTIGGGYGETAGLASGRNLHESAKYCAHMIGEVAGVVAMHRRTALGKQVAFYGLESDRMYADYLLSLIHIAMDTECARYLASPQRTGHGRTARASFMPGMAERINDRLESMLSDTSKRKARMAMTEYRNTGKRLRGGARNGPTIRDGAAYGAGGDAAGRVALNKTVGDRAARIAAR